MFRLKKNTKYTNLGSLLAMHTRHQLKTRLHFQHASMFRELERMSNCVLPSTQPVNHTAKTAREYAENHRVYWELHAAPCGEVNYYAAWDSSGMKPHSTDHDEWFADDVGAVRVPWKIDGKKVTVVGDCVRTSKQLAAIIQSIFV